MSMVPPCTSPTKALRLSQRHHLAGPHALGEHPGEDIDLIVVGDRAEYVCLIDAFLPEQVLVRCVAMQDHGSVESLGQPLCSLGRVLDELDLNLSLQRRCESAADVPAAREQDSDARACRACAALP